MNTQTNAPAVTPAAAPFSDATAIPPAAPAAKIDPKAPIKKLAHTKENWSIAIAGKTNDEIIADAKEHNLKLGKKTLEVLLAGTHTTMGDFEMIEVKYDPKAAKAAATAAKAAQAAAKAAAATKPEGETAAPAAPKTKGPKQLTEAQAQLANEVEKQIPTRETQPPVEKAPRVLNDVSHLLPKPGVYTPLLRGTTMARLFEMLVRPQGATKAEMMAPADQGGFGWSAGGLAGIIHWEPKKKGYTLVSEKIDGVIHYHLAYHKDDPERPNGHNQRVTLEQLTYREKKPAPVVKTAEEKAAEKAAKDATKAAAKAAADAAKPVKEAAPAKETKVKVPKDAPPASAGNITKRVSNKKAAENAAK